MTGPGRFAHGYTAAASAVLVLAAAARVAAQAPGTVAPPETLVLDGVPPIEASIAAQSEKYTNYRTAAFVDWRPGGHEMLISTRFGDTPQLHLVRAPGAARRQLTFYRDSVTRAAYPPDRGDSLVFQKDVGGGEWYQLYRWDETTRAATLLTDGKSRNVLGPWAKDGSRVAYTSTRRDGKDSDLWTIDPRDPKSDRMLASVEGGGWEPLDWSPDGRRIVVREQISAAESYLWLFDASSGEKTEVTPRRGAPKAYWGDALFSADGRSLFVTSDAGSEFRRLLRLDLATKRTTPLTAEIPWNVDEIELTRDGRRLAFTTDENGMSVLYVRDTETGAALPAPKLPPGAVSRIGWDGDGHLLGFALTTAESPTDAYSWNPDTRILERWTESESEAPTAGFPPAELVTWKSFDGRVISGFLYHPSPERFPGKSPVLVVVHGGPESQMMANFVGRSNYFVDALGVALLYPNVRGSYGYGRTFLSLDDGFRREDSYRDVAAAFDWIATRPDLDASRIAITGGSYGGHTTLAVSAFYADRIRCSVDVVGMSNLVTFLEHTEAYRRDLRRVEYGDERDPKMRAFLERIAPMNNLEKIVRPMMVVAGKNDPRVPVSESDQIVRALKQQGTPVWYVLAKDEGHGFSKKPDLDFQFYATVAFLQKYLLP